MNNFTRTFQQWLDNEEGTWDRMQRYAKDALDEAIDEADPEDEGTLVRSKAVEKLGGWIKDYLESGMPRARGMWQDILTDVMQEVDWDEFAEHYLDDMKFYSVHNGSTDDREFFREIDDARGSLISLMPPQISDELENRIQDLPVDAEIEIDGVTYVIKEH